MLDNLFVSILAMKIECERVTNLLAHQRLKLAL